MTNSISNRQMFFMLFMTLTAYSSISIAKEITEHAGTGGWIVVLFASIVFAFAAMCVVRLNSRHEGQMLLDYAPKLITRAGAYTLTSVYVLYLFFVTVFLIFEVSNLLKADFLPHTPLWVFSLVGVPVYCFIAYKGITNVARLAEIIGVAYLAAALFVHILMITEGNLNRILPLLNVQDLGKYASALPGAIFPFLGFEILLTVPFIRRKGIKAHKAAFLSILGIGAFYILLIESSIMKIGSSVIIYYKDALIVAIRDTSPEFLRFFARLDILYLTVGFSGLFLGISIAITAITEYVCRMFKKAKRAVVVACIGAAAFGANLLTGGIEGYDEFAQSAGSMAGFLLAVIVPVVLLIIAKIKERQAKQS